MWTMDRRKKTHLNFNKKEEEGVVQMLKRSYWLAKPAKWTESEPSEQRHKAREWPVAKKRVSRVCMGTKIRTLQTCTSQRSLRNTLELTTPSPSKTTRKLPRPLQRGKGKGLRHPHCTLLVLSMSNEGLQQLRTQKMLTKSS